MDDIRVHTSDIPMTCKWYTDDILVTCKYIWVTYRWHTRAYKGHTITYEWHTHGIRVHTSDIQMTYEWHTDDILVYMSDDYISVHMNDIGIAYGYIYVDNIRAQTNHVQVDTSDIRMTY